MSTRKSGIALFSVGVIFLFIHTTMPFLWALVGIPSAYPLASSEGVWAVLPGFTPLIGGMLLMLGGLLYGKEKRSN